MSSNHDVSQLRAKSKTKVEASIMEAIRIGSEQNETCTLSAEGKVLVKMSHLYRLGLFFCEILL